MNDNDSDMSAFVHLGSDLLNINPYHSSFYLEIPDQCSKFIYQEARGCDENQKSDKMMISKI